MKNLQDYSEYYDKLYQDKDYPGETDFILKILNKYSTGKITNLLSLGCGTCTYELLMAQKGLKITGIDLSKKMLNIASKKIKDALLESKIKIFKKDARKFRFKNKFDSSMAMFNIVGLQTKNSDFEKMLANVSGSLKKGGIFVFDCWYLPAVLKDRPKDKVKIIKIKGGNITRSTKSTINTKDNIIKIEFGIVEKVGKKVINTAKEIHYVRYWSLPELEYFINKAGFSVIKMCNFMDPNSEISENNWNIFVVVRKQI